MSKVSPQEKMVVLNLLGVHDWIMTNSTSERLGLLGIMLSIVVKSFLDEKEVLLFEYLKRYQAGIDPELAAVEKKENEQILEHNIKQLVSEKEQFSTLGIEVNENVGKECLEG